MPHFLGFVTGLHLCCGIAYNFYSPHIRTLFECLWSGMNYVLYVFYVLWSSNLGLIFTSLSEWLSYCQYLMLVVVYLKLKFNPVIVAGPKANKINEKNGPFYSLSWDLPSFLHSLWVRPTIQISIKLSIMYYVKQKTKDNTRMQWFANPLQTKCMNTLQSKNS